MESVTDSSRYFVIRICDDNGRTAFIGIGFADRGDSFDFNVTLQDHFKRVKTEQSIDSTPDIPPDLNLGFKRRPNFFYKTWKFHCETKSKAKIQWRRGYAASTSTWRCCKTQRTSQHHHVDVRMGTVFKRFQQ